jgi:WD40 repeat protein
VNWVGFSPDGQAIASVSEDKTLKFWRLDGNLITTLSSHTAPIFEASFSQNKKLLATAGQDGKVVIWNLDLPSLINQGCSWLGDYQRHNPNAEAGVCDR